MCCVDGLNPQPLSDIQLGCDNLEKLPGATMNWEAIGAVGEIFGALAVVVSLVYLATQIRSQNRESRIAASHEITTAFQGVESV